MASRFSSRLSILAHAGVTRLTAPRRRQPAAPKRILISHHLLLGDTIMLTPLLAKLREQFPTAEVVMATPRSSAVLYQRKPYGVEAIPFDPRDRHTLRDLVRRGPFDLALVPGDNRYSWQALAAGARWIVAFSGDRPGYKSWPVDELKYYQDIPCAWGDMVADLVAGPAPQPFDRVRWPSPDHRPFSLPPGPYCVLHVGASSMLKLWEAPKWLAIATHLTTLGYHVVWSGGRGEQKYVSAIDPSGNHPSFAGKLDLPQLWHLLENAALLICPDTGVAHLGRVTDTPTIALFGPGSASLYGKGEFWKDSCYQAITIENFPCRNQRSLFKREIEWVRRCARTPQECAQPACMHAIDTLEVEKAIISLLEKKQSRVCT